MSLSSLIFSLPLGEVSIRWSLRCRVFLEIKHTPVCSSLHSHHGSHLLILKDVHLNKTDSSLSTDSSHSDVLDASIVISPPSAVRDSLKWGLSVPITAGCTLSPHTDSVQLKRLCGCSAATETWNGDRQWVVSLDVGFIPARVQSFPLAVP